MTTLLRCSLGDLTISTGLLRLPLRGNWTCTVEIGHDTAGPAMGSPVSVVLVRENGSEDVFVGTVRRSGFVDGSKTIYLTVVGGNGKLINTIPALDQRNGSTPLPAGLVARAIVDAAGEQLATGVETALDALTMARWTRVSGEAQAAVDLLAERLGLGWRVLANGRVWIGRETWLATKGTAFQTAGKPEDGIVEYAPDGAPFLPGETVDGLQAVAVEYQIATGALRCEVRGELSGDPPHVADAAAYACSYQAITRAGDDFGDLLHVSPDDDRLPDLRDIPFRVGIPGALASIPLGSYVRVHFEDQDPRAVYATSTDQDESAIHNAALVGDTVDCGWYTGMAPSLGGPVVFAQVPPGTPTAINIMGTITGPGSQRVKLS